MMDGCAIFVSMKQPIISDLTSVTKHVIAKLKEFEQVPEAALIYRETQDSWNVLECIEHLKRYSDFYLPEISKQLDHAGPYRKPFRSGWLGGYFAKLMKPGAAKMNTFKSMNPMKETISAKVIRVFLEQQEKTLEILRRADQSDLTRTRAAITLSKWIRLRLGDILQVVIYHNQRHILQAEKALKAYHASHSI